jgi:hypothetical protein
MSVPLLSLFSFLFHLYFLPFFFYLLSTPNFCLILDLA